LVAWRARNPSSVRSPKRASDGKPGQRSDMVVALGAPKVMGINDHRDDRVVVLAVERIREILMASCAVSVVPCRTLRRARCSSVRHAADRMAPVGAFQAVPVS
jgi:hypothetical protein